MGSSSPVVLVVSLTLLFLVTTVPSADTEEVLVEDISTELPSQARPYDGSPTGRRGSGKTSSTSSSTADRKGKRKRDSGGGGREKVPVSASSITEGIERVRKLLGELLSHCADYRSVLHDDEHIQVMQKGQEEALKAIASLWTDSQREEKEDPSVFKPLTDEILKLNKMVTRARELTRAQIDKHLDFMRRTQALLPFYSGPAEETRALRAYLNQHVKKGKPSSKQNLLEMEALQRSIRGQFWLGLTWAELGMFGAAISTPVGILVVAQAVAIWVGWMSRTSLIGSLGALTAALVIAYPALIGPISPFLLLRHRVAHVVVGVLTLLAVALVVVELDLRIRLFLGSLRLKRKGQLKPKKK
eukprot:RCo040754